MASRWSALIPRLLKSDPQLTFTAMTEFTAEGRQWRAVSPDAPAYYVFHALGAQSKGEPVKETALGQRELEPLLMRALAKNGFLAAREGHSPELAVIYMWGSHYSYDPDEPGVSEDAIVRNILDRAALVGGKKFAAQLARAYRDTEDILWSSPPALEGPVNEAGFGPVGIASSMAQLNSRMSPLHLFANNHQALFDQARGDCYFVVASFYDHALLAKNAAILLWRTRLTVTARGVSQLQALPSLVAAAAPYLGKETPDPIVMKARAIRAGNVEIGTPILVR